MGSRGAVPILSNLISQSGLSTVNEVLLEPCRLPYTSAEQVLRCTQASIENTPKPSWLESTLVPIIQPISNFLLPGSGAVTALVQTGSGLGETPNIRSGLNPVQRFLNQGGNMGFFDDVFGSNDSPGDNFNAGLAPSTSFDFNQLLNVGVGALGNFLQGQNSQGVPPMLQSNMAMLPAVRAGVPMIRSGGAILAARLTSLGLTKSTAWSMLKKFGPASLVGVGLTSLEIAQIAQSKGGHRRMNMCNGRALRRASRRLEGFHKFYKRTCGLPVHRRKSSRSCK